MLRRVVIWLIVAGALLFALQGGEYSTVDLWTQRQHKRALVARTDSLSMQVDSLRKVAEAIEKDPATQERIAREEFGMVKGDKEILYRFGGPEDTARNR